MKSSENVPTNIPVMLFKRPRDWAAWLDKHHAMSSGVWLMLAKKAAGITSVSYDAILFRIQTAKKAETRAKRIQQFVGMLEKKEKLYS